MRIAFLVILAMTVQSFDYEIAEDLFQYTRMSYCKNDKLYEWNTEAAQRHPFMNEVQVFTNDTHEAQGYCGYDIQHDRVVIAIRGSDNLKNWIQNLNFFFEDYNCPKCKVHRGFHNVYEDLVNNLLGCAYTLTSNHPTAKLFVTGHSLGAAQAAFAAIEISDVVKNVDEIYLYGQPRVGNEHFAKYIEKRLSHTQIYRVVNDHDIIPHFGTKWMGFKHFGQEVFLKKDGGYELCQGDKRRKCSNKYFWPWQWSLKDHLIYFGQCAGCTQEGCNKYL